MNIFDLSHSISSQMQIYPGDPEVVLEEGLTFENDYCHVDVLKLNSHTGTHIDAPFHFFPSGKKIDEFDINTFFGKGIVIDFSYKHENEPIIAEEVFKYDEYFKKIDFVVLKTEWFRYFGSEKYLKHPYISDDLALYLCKKGIKIVAVDFLSADSTVLQQWDAHKIFLQNEVLIVENLNNTNVLKNGDKYDFAFFPLKLKNSDGSPLRAVVFL